MAIQSWTFACSHVLAGENPLLCSDTTSTSTEDCAGYKQNTSDAQKKDVQSLSIYKKQIEYIRKDLRKAKRARNLELAQELEKMKKNCFFLWVKKIGGIEFRKYKNGNCISEINTEIEVDIRKTIDIVELLADTTEETWGRLYMKFDVQSVRLVEVREDYQKFKKMLLLIQETLKEIHGEIVDVIQVTILSGGFDVTSI